MLTVTINEDTPVGKAISDAAEQFGLDASAFATGLLAATLQRKADAQPAATPAEKNTPAEAPAATTAPAPRFGSLR